VTLASPDGATDLGPETGRLPAEGGRPDEPEWVRDLSTPGPRHDEALRQLHALLLKAARHQVWHMRDMLPGVGVGTFEELAHCAADDALVAVLGKLDSFEGRSRFTTWAYKFAILQAANEVRRQAWSSREVSLPDDGPWSDESAGPEQHAEASDLAAAVATAMAVALTGYQRRIAVALLIQHVPIDVLADRLGTTRGALYKTLHVARSRLRAHLTASGHLTPARGETS
jgi:RNA polymerase sigma-70 factor (ECF subfamily)